MALALLETLNLPFVQRGLLEIMLLAIPCGLIGSWIILRGLAFHSHAVGTATFPGLVLADGLGFAAFLGAFGAAALFSLLAVSLARSRRSGTDSVTALTLSACLATGVILASDVFGSGANVDNLLFGSLLAIDSGDLWLAGLVAALALGASLLFGPHWLARGFDGPSAGRRRPGSFAIEASLLTIIGATVVAAIGAVGALLVSTLIVVPAATARLFATRVRTLQATSILLVMLEGTFGLWLSVETNAPPGATIAVISGAVFLLVLGARWLRINRVKPLAAAVLILALTGLIAGCDSQSSDGEGPKVVATTTQVGDLVATVGGDRVDLTTILKPNTDPHEYEPRPSDVAAVAEATIIFRSGSQVDEWTGQLIEDSGSEAEVIDLSRDLPVRLFGDQQGEELDPHWWGDPVNVASATARIEAALSQAHPGSSGWYRARARHFEGEIRNLTGKARACLRRIPAVQRKIVTDHDAFAYFTDRFGIETVGTVIPAQTTEAQPSAGDLAELEDTIERERVKAIFPEKSVSASLAETLAEDTGLTAAYPLYSDTLGPEGSGGETWLKATKSNVDAVVAGITGGRETCFGSSDG